MSIKVDHALIQKLKSEVIDRKLKLDYQRTDILSEVYKEYEGEPQIIIRARFLERLLREKKIYIDDYLFVGNLAGEFGAFYLYPEWNNSLRTHFPLPMKRRNKSINFLHTGKREMLPIALPKHTRNFMEKISASISNPDF